MYHPDVPSTSNDSTEVRLAKFHAINAAQEVLTDDRLRSEYDRSLTGYHRRPTYTQGGPSQSGFGGGQAAAWSTENNYRRERANYAWAHPSRRGGEANSASANARAREDPFARTAADNNGPSMDDHYHRFAKQQARANSRTQAMKNRQHFAANGSPFSSGAAGYSAFGAKAEEESRLVNDSGVKRSGQVRAISDTTSI